MPTAKRSTANDKLAALVFKTVSDPNIGRLSYVRVYSGTLSADSHVWNCQKSKDERIGQVFHVRGKNQEPTQRLVTGDIGVIPKLAETVTGDTLARGIAASRCRDRVSARGVLRLGASQVAQRRRQAQHGHVAAARRGPEPADAPRGVDQRGHPVGPGRFAPRGGDQRLQRKFGVNVTLDVPKVAYRETVTGKGTAEGRHVRQSGGHGQYGVVNLEIEPTSRGEGFAVRRQGRRRRGAASSSSRPLKRAYARHSIRA